MPSESLPDNRDIWRIAAPMILSNISVPLLGMVDTGVTGHLDDAVYLGAVAIGSTIFGFLYAGFNFLRMGTTGITAQKFGANDGEGLKVALGQALIVSLAIAATLILLQVPIAALAMQILGPEQGIAQFAKVYFDIRIWSAPATLANYALIGWFIGLQNARVPLYIVLAINVTNIILDLVFVLGLGMTVDGVAAASVIAEFTGLIVGIWFAIAHLKRYDEKVDVSHLVTLKEYTAFFAVNLHLLVRTMALMFTFAFVTAAGARLGGLVLAANAVLINMMHLMSFALDGFAHAAEALVGKAVGAKNRASLERAVSLALRWSLYVAVLFSLFFLVAGRPIIRLLTDIPEVIEVADAYAPWLVLMPMVAV
ncbi:MAG: MATE family efflux transporter, partial [Woeseiaceae bacterium]